MKAYIKYVVETDDYYLVPTPAKYEDEFYPTLWSETLATVKVPKEFYDRYQKFLSEAQYIRGMLYNMSRGDLTYKAARDFSDALDESDWV